MSKTAAELMAELERDPEFVRRRAEREADLETRAASHKRDEATLVSQIRAVGYPIDSVYDFVNGTSTYQDAYPVLVQHLDEPHDERIREGIIRALTVRDLDEKSLAALLANFRDESNRYLKWVLANALETALPASRKRELPEIAEVFASDPFR